MTRMKLERNTNRDAKPAGHQKEQKVRSAPAPGGQKGRFVGLPAGVHIHIVSDNTHIKIGGNGERKNFDPSNDTQVRAVRTWLESKGKGKKGYAECHAWLGYPSRERV